MALLFPYIVSKNNLSFLKDKISGLEFNVFTLTMPENGCHYSGNYQVKISVLNVFFFFGCAGTLGFNSSV